jgi:hypothetical protein
VNYTSWSFAQLTQASLKNSFETRGSSFDIRYIVASMLCFI